MSLYIFKNAEGEEIQVEEMDQFIYKAHQPDVLGFIKLEGINRADMRYLWGMVIRQATREGYKLVSVEEIPKRTGTVHLGIFKNKINLILTEIGKLINRLDINA